MVMANMNTRITFHPLSSSIFPRKYPNFLFIPCLDSLDSVFCLISKYLDKFFKGEASPRGKIGILKTLHDRQKKLKNKIDLLEFVGKLLNKNKSFKSGYTYFEIQNKVCSHSHRLRDPKLHVAVKEASSKDQYEAHYLDACSNCGKSLHKSDIFMYRGNIPFCSNECRQEQIEMDEVRENKLRIERCLKEIGLIRCRNYNLRTRFFDGNEARERSERRPISYGTHC